jgi:hypothetical protein
MSRSCMTHYLATAALVLTAGARLEAQGPPDPNLKPTYGSVKLSAGFQPDPYIVEVQAGGEVRTNLGGVAAHVARAPDFSLHYTGGKYPLHFTVKSVGDTTLLINLPDGSWSADDDSGGGLAPLVRIVRPASGRYDVYVGTYHKDLVAAKLHISEQGALKKPLVALNPNLPECFIVSAGVDNYRSADRLKGCLNDARNTVAAFEAQVGSTFRAVKNRLLLDEQASHGAILAALKNLTTEGAAGDYMVLFLSGHGGRTRGNTGPTWFFMPVDFQPAQFVNTALTDKQILDLGDQLVRQQKNVVIIVDACYCGQLEVTARPYLERYRSKDHGSMTLLLSSAPDQVSSALGNYSAYAKAFADALAGGGDLNGDSKISLDELRIDAKKRTARLLAAARIAKEQDPVVAWSPSLSKETILAHAARAPAEVATALPEEAPRRFTGNETLPGYGTLSFALYSNGRAVMVDAKSTSEGIWRQQGSQYTLSFANGAIIYSGTLQGTTLSGSATAPAPRQQAKKFWSWSVQQQRG